MTKLPEFAEWKAPWEKSEEDIDADKAKKFIYSLLQQNQTLKDEVATVTKAKDEVQTKLDEVERKDESEADRIKRENEELKARLAKGSEESAEVRALRLEVALDKGLSKVQAKRLVGSTREELEADADDIVKSWGGKGETEEESEETPPRRQPRRTGTPGDPDPDAGKDVSVDDALKKIPRL